MTTSKKHKVVKEAFAVRLRRTREARGLTLAELGRRAGLSHQAIMKMEGGETENPGILTVADLAGGLEVPESWLAYGVGEEPAGLTAAGDATQR